MCENRYIPLLLLWLLSAGPPGLSAQTGAPKNTIDAIWPQIESRLDNPDSDSTLSAMLAHVRDRCDGEYDCLYQSYRDLMFRLERKFRLLPAIRVCNEIVRIAHEQNDLEAEAGACMSLNRYYGAIGKKQSATINLDNALHLYAQTGNQPAVIHARMTKMEQSLDYRKFGDVLPEMEALLAGAVANRDTQSATYLHIRLLLHCQTLERYDEMAEHIEALEKVPLSDPIRSNEYSIAIHAALGRADLARARKNPEEAKRYYQKTLHLCEAEPSRWLEIRVLQSMAELAQEQRQSDLAKSYLDKAEAKAEKLQLHDLLSRNYGLKAEIAEAEGRYPEALRYTKEKILNEQKFKEKSAGFDLQNYYLQLEKDQLTTEKANSALELSLKKNQLRSSLIILVLALLLAVSFVLAYLYQHKQRKVLIDQKALIQDQTEVLLSLDQLKSHFFANVSHELRTPLTLILGPISSVLKSGEMSTRNFTHLKKAQQSGKDLLKLVASILDLSKMESGKMELHEKPEVLFPLLRRIASAFESHAQRSGIEFVFNYKAEKDLQLLLDREKLETILNNLLSNAIKFTPAGGKINVTVEDLGNGLRLSVADTGRGVHPGDLPNIFDRFYQSRQPDAPTEGGTGIGLALCQELAKIMGGRIWVESEPGAGSAFFVELPRREVLGSLELTTWSERAADMENVTYVEDKLHGLVLPADPARNVDNAIPTILIVEDNHSLRDYIQSILSPFYHILTAENGQDAWDGQLPAANCQLIISDIMMPVMDGFQFLEKLKSDDRYRHLPVIMLTARADMQDKLRALRIGVDDYLLKPFEEEELLARIENALRNRDARREWLDANPNESKSTEPSPEASWLEQLDDCLAKNLDNFQLNVDYLAQLMNMSRSVLYRSLQKETGLSVNQYIQEARLQRARTLLEAGEVGNLSELAAAVGFRTGDYLSRLYRERFGKSPAESL